MEELLLSPPGMDRRCERAAVDEGLSSSRSAEIMEQFAQEDRGEKLLRRYPRDLLPVGG